MESNVAELEKETNREPLVPPQPEPEKQRTPSRWADPKVRRALLWGAGRGGHSDASL